MLIHLIEIKINVKILFSLSLMMIRFHSIIVQCGTVNWVQLHKYCYLHKYMYTQ